MSMAKAPALTTRNVFIANLALSDLMLCCFTMPLTLVDLVTLYWQLGPDKVTITVTENKGVRKKEKKKNEKNIITHKGQSKFFVAIVKTDNIKLLPE